MQIVLGQYAGFCPGVKRAWSLVSCEAARKKNGPIFVLGELIHNHQAIEKIEGWGVRTIEKVEETNGQSGVLIIRAHGEPPNTYQKLAKTKLKVIDATCPSVARVQKLAKETEKAGYQVFVCGEEDHPEALATVGYTRRGQILPSVEAAQAVLPTEKIGVLSQTTFSPQIFDQICQVLRKKCRQFKSLGTICNFVQLAQKEGRKIADMVDLVIVVGGRQSSNTKRLAEVAQEQVRTYHIETAKEIQAEWFGEVRKVGLLAGASTPAWIINQVTKKLKNIKTKKQKK